MLPLILLVVGVLAQQTFAEEHVVINGGRLVAPGEDPYHVFLKLGDYYICSGSIINQTKILTAASCVNYIVDSPYLSNFTIVTGTINTTGGEIHTVKNIIIHSGYTGKLTNSFQNDIAIITLTDSIKYNQNQKPITLAITEPTHKQKCTLTRWGSIKTNDGSIKSILEKMDEDVIDRKRCNNFDIRLRNTQLCAFNRLRNGNCMNDRGGPLICNGEQAGINAWVFPCANRDSDIYTNIAYYRKFILSALENA